MTSAPWPEWAVLHGMAWAVCNHASHKPLPFSVGLQGRKPPHNQFLSVLLSPERRVLVPPFRGDVSVVHLSHCAEPKGGNGWSWPLGHADGLQERALRSLFWIWNLALPLASCVTLGKLGNFSEPWSSLCKTGIIISKPHKVNEKIYQLSAKAQVKAQRMEGKYYQHHFISASIVTFHGASIPVYLFTECQPLSLAEVLCLSLRSGVTCSYETHILIERNGQATYQRLNKKRKTECVADTMPSIYYVLCTHFI